MKIYNEELEVTLKKEERHINEYENSERIELIAKCDEKLEHIKQLATVLLGGDPNDAQNE